MTRHSLSRRLEAAPWLTAGILIAGVLLLIGGIIDGNWSLTIVALFAAAVCLFSVGSRDNPAKPSPPRARRRR